MTFAKSPALAEINTAKSWRGVSVQYSRLQLPTDYEFRWDGESHYLAHHDLILEDGEMEVRGEQPVQGRDLRDQMTYVPQGQTITGWAKPADRLNAFTVVCFDPATMEEELQVEFGTVEPRPHIYFQDQELGTTMRKLGRLMADLERPAAKVYAEAVGLTAALEMVRLQSEHALRVVKPGELSQSQRRLVLDYIEANLASDIGLDDLAAVAVMTRFHFSRAFKATFGEPPYQFVIRRRIERARQLLAESRLSVADVAQACGFGNASQFTRTFRDIVGVPPLAFRKSI
ncbi:AraC family transcriptional regulator [Rhizobium rhizoryzae]|uniref:AraC family transcriptional regulator n=1 Tax=Rhizobium rhizoryzae TaxID=451876 RepID=UPI0028B0C085|nr:AraC family transcriptional regulator [Rhizobium rhizoryzae]